MCDQRFENCENPFSVQAALIEMNRLDDKFKDNYKLTKLLVNIMTIDKVNYKSKFKLKLHSSLSILQEL
jgi:hypothetical protein